MKLTEKDAIEQLVSLGIMQKEIAEFIETFSRDGVYYSDKTDGEYITPFTLLIDKSTSIHPPSHPENSLLKAIIEGQNHLINSLLGASDAIDVYIGQILFDNSIHYFQNLTPLRDKTNFRKLNSGIKLLNYDNFHPSGGTSLYDAIGKAISMLLPTWVGGYETGQTVLPTIAILTDGIDEHSKTTPQIIKDVVTHLLDIGILHRITLVGIGNFNYKDVGVSLGINQVIEVDRKPNEIRKAMDIISSQITDN